MSLPGLSTVENCVGPKRGESHRGTAGADLILESGVTATLASPGLLAGSMVTCGDVGEGTSSLLVAAALRGDLDSGAGIGDQVRWDAESVSSRDASGCIPASNDAPTVDPMDPTIADDVRFCGEGEAVRERRPEQTPGEERLPSPSMPADLSLARTWPRPLKPCTLWRRSRTSRWRATTEPATACKRPVVCAEVLSMRRMPCSSAATSEMTTSPHFPSRAAVRAGLSGAWQVRWVMNPSHKSVTCCSNFDMQACVDCCKSSTSCLAAASPASRASLSNWSPSESRSLSSTTANSSASLASRSTSNSARKSTLMS
mmetsp:Transcript_130561/g.279112  ORF Transcript_130561/g.279112 Transcript_130561/m.279112 type:complete len:314 (-) Transcript_130561:152-1093(-)